MPKTLFNPFTNKLDFVDDGTDSTSVSAVGTLADNAVIRGDGGSRGVQDSGVIIDDSDNVTGVVALTTTSLSTGAITADSLTLTTDLAVIDGGTGASSFTDGFVLLGSGTSAITALDVTAKGSILVGDGTTDPVALAVGADAFVLTADSSEASGLKWAAAGGGSSIIEHVFQASDFELNEANFADLLLQSGTNVKRKVLAFANATTDQEEFANFVDHVPADIDTTGNVTIRLYVMAATAAASKNVEFRLSYIPLNDGEDFDVAYTTVDSGDVAIDATQDNQTELTFTFAASSLAANDQFEAMISRIAASANDLTGDAYVRSMAIEYPI